MGESRVDHATIAFRLALAEAITNEQTRVDALLALWQRSVLVATWPGPNDAARTLNNSHSESALPLFTAMDTLEAAATRFGWHEADGSLRFRELPAREALRHALSRQVNFVVMDVGFEHSVEFAREELEPLLRQIGSTGPGTTGANARQAAVLEAVRRNSRPPPSATPVPAPPPHSLTRALAEPAPANVNARTPAGPAARKAHASPPPPPASPRPPPLPPSAAARRTPLPSPSPSPSPPPVPRPSPTPPASRARPPSEPQSPPLDARRRVRDDEPTLAERPNRGNTPRTTAGPVPDSALQALSSELRGFPEVEWACVLLDESEVPLIGVRIDPSFLNRVADITDVILDVGERQSVALQVLLLNNQDQVKNARRNGRAFYPWTR